MMRYFIQCVVIGIRLFILYHHRTGERKGIFLITKMPSSFCSFFFILLLLMQ